MRSPQFRRAAAEFASMGSRTREQRPRRARCVGVAVFVLLAVAVGGGAHGVAVAADGPSASQPRALTDTQLEASARELDAEATRIGEQLLQADARRDQIIEERDVASELLATFLAQTYKQGSVGTSIIAQVFGAGTLQEAADRVRVAQIVGAHHGNLIHSLDAAKAELDVSRIDRARLITRLAWVQARVVALQGEQTRRVGIRQAHERERAAKAARARDKQASEQQAVLAAQRSAVPGVLAAGATPRIQFATPGSPPSAALIDAYLAQQGSPMTGQGSAFMASAARWQVDPRLLVAIAGAESSFGEVTCGPNNAWGWACPNDPADFATWADGIDTVTRGLREYYLNEGRTSVALIQQKYCPVGAANDPTGLNSHWATNVTRILLELGGNPTMVGPGPSGGALQLPAFGVLLGGD